MKRIFLTAAVGVLFGLPVTHASFSDVPETHINADAIAYVQEQGIVSGYADGTYKPNAPINRAEFLKIVAEAFDTDDLIQACQNPVNGSLQHKPANFSDVRASEWYARYICAATQHGNRNPVAGYPDGTFKPGNNITFVEASKLILSYMDTRHFEDQEEGGVNNPQSFVAEGPNPYDGPWYIAFVGYMQRHNIIPLSITKLDQPITRGEMAEMIFRLDAKLYGKQGQNGLMGEKIYSNDGAEQQMPMNAKDVTVLQRYYELIGVSKDLKAAYAMRANDDVDFATFETWYKDLYTTQLFHLVRYSNGEYAYKVLLSMEGKRELYQVRSKVLASGAIETVSSEEIGGAELQSVWKSYGMSVSVLFDNGDIVLMGFDDPSGQEDGFEIDRIKEPQNLMEAVSEFYDISFHAESSQPYLSYKIGVWESNMSVVYDWEKREKILAQEATFSTGFTNNDRYFWACTENCSQIKVFSTTDFAPIEVPLDGIVTGTPAYSIADNALYFTEDPTPATDEDSDVNINHTFDFTTLKLE